MQQHEFNGILPSLTATHAFHIYQKPLAGRLFDMNVFCKYKSASSFGIEKFRLCECVCVCDAVKLYLLENKEDDEHNLVGAAMLICDPVRWRQ